MGREHVVRTGERIYAQIERVFGSDAAFERAANLPPKTVNNWRRGRSASYMKLLPELAELFGVPVKELMGDAGADDLTAEEKSLLAMYREADALTAEERAALHETLRRTIDLYLGSHRPE